MLLPFSENSKNISKDTLANILPEFKEKRTRSFATLVFTLLAIIFFSLFAIQPTLTTIAQLKKQLEDENFTDQKMLSKIKALQSLQKSYALITPNIPNVLTSIPEMPEIPSFFGKLQTIALTTGVTLVRIQTFPVAIINNASQLTQNNSSIAFSLDANGSKGSITLFLNKILFMDRLVSIDGFSLAQASQTNDNQRLTIKGSIYFKKTSP